MKTICPSRKSKYYADDFVVLGTDVISGDCVWHLVPECVPDEYIHHYMGTVQAVYIPEQEKLLIGERFRGHRDANWKAVFRCPDFKTASFIAHLAIDVVEY